MVYNIIGYKKIWGEIMRLTVKCYKIILLFIIFSFCSCITEKPIRGYYLSSIELETIDIIGYIETEFEATRYYDENALLQKGYNELLIIAKKQYGEDIDIKNLHLEKRNSSRNLWYAIFQIYTNHYIIVNAKGVIIKI